MHQETSVAWEQALQDTLVEGQEKEGELATASQEFGILPLIPLWLPVD